MCFRAFCRCRQWLSTTKKDKFSTQFNRDLIPISTTQIGLFGCLLIALLIIIFTQSRCQFAVIRVRVRVYIWKVQLFRNPLNFFDHRLSFNVICLNLSISKSDNLGFLSCRMRRLSQICLLYSWLVKSWLKPKKNPLLNAFLSGPPCSRARNTDTFQVVIYEAQFFSQSVMGRFLFLTHNVWGDYMPCVIKWKLHGKVCFKLDKTHQVKGTILT